MYKRKQRTAKLEEPHADHEVEIHNYTPNVSLTPQDYALSSHLLDLELNFRSTVQAFFNNTNIDEFNATFIDGVIASAEREALADLYRQKADHTGKINHLIEKLWRGDKIKAEAKLAQNERELQECQKELEQLERIYYHGTSMDGESSTVSDERKEGI